MVMKESIFFMTNVYKSRIQAKLYNNKVFGVDSNIKKGKYGEVLFIKKKRFFKGNLSGKSVKF